MKKQLSIVMVGAFSFALGLGFNDIAKSHISSDFRVGIVDVNAVVAKSSEVQALKKEQIGKVKELQKWVETTKKDVEKQSTDENKQKLAKKYSAELVKKQNEIQKNYTQKLKNIDKNITEIIAQEAQKQEYNLILNKSNVLYGGDNITESIIKAVK